MQGLSRVVFRSIALHTATFCLVAAAPLTAATVRWTGATDSNWNTPTNWALLSPTAADDVVFDPLALYPADLKLQLDADVVVGTLHISGDFDAIGDYTFEPLEGNTNTLTIASGQIEADIPTTGTTNKSIEFDSDIAFGSTLSILRIGNAVTGTRRLIFNQGLSETASNLNVIINNEANNNRQSVRFRDSLDWTGTTTIERGSVELSGSRVDPTFGNASSLVTIASLGNATIRMTRNASAGDATTENDFQIGAGGNVRFFASGGNSTTETWTISGDFSGGSTSTILAFDMGQSDSIRIDGDLDVDSQLEIRTPEGATLGSVLLDGRLIDAAGVTIETDATLAGSGTVDFRIDNGLGTSFGGSAIDVDGTFDISNLTLNILELGTGADGVSEYVIADYSDGQSVGGTFATLTGLPAGYTINTAANGGTQIVLAIVPEPSPGLPWTIIVAAAIYRRIRAIADAP